MVSFSLKKCPFCLKENVAGTILHFDFLQSHKCNLLGRCNHCLNGIVGQVNIGNLSQLAGYHPQEQYYRVQEFIRTSEGNIEDDEFILSETLTWFPKPPEIDIPANLPKNVEEKFRQAERLSNLIDMRDPAGNAYRATLERSILHIDASLTGGNLYSKIEKLAKNGQITEDLKNFAHQIRVLGNDATHNDDDITQEELNNLSIFTRMFLMYVFTLPAMIPQTVTP